MMGFDCKLCMRSTSAALQIFPNEIARIAWKKANYFHAPIDIHGASACAQNAHEKDHRDIVFCFHKQRKKSRAHCRMRVCVMSKYTRNVI